MKTVVSRFNLLYALTMVCLGFLRTRAFVRVSFSHGIAPSAYAFWRSSARPMASVTGKVYSSDEASAPKVTLFTKEGCTLCDKVKEVLLELRDELPHSLEQIDITDDDHPGWYSKYKYDIPVLHMNDKFWIKHRTTVDEARKGLQRAREGTFEEQSGEPDAGAMERRKAE